MKWIPPCRFLNSSSVLPSGSYSLKRIGLPTISEMARLSLAGSPCNSPGISVSTANPPGLRLQSFLAATLVSFSYLVAMNYQHDRALVFRLRIDDKRVDRSPIVFHRYPFKVTQRLRQLLLSPILCRRCLHQVPVQRTTLGENNHGTEAQIYSS